MKLPNKWKYLAGSVYFLILCVLTINSVLYSLQITTLVGDVEIGSNDNFIWKFSWEQDRKYLVQVQVQSGGSVDILLVDRDNFGKIEDGIADYETISAGTKLNASVFDSEILIPKTQEYYLVIENRNFTTNGANSIGEVKLYVNFEETMTPLTVLELIIHWSVLIGTSLILIYIIKFMEPFSPTIYTQESEKLLTVKFDDPHEYCFYPGSGEKRYQLIKSILISLTLLLVIIFLFYSISVIIDERFYIDLPFPEVISLLLYVLRIGLFVMFLSWLLIDYFFGRYLSWPFIMIGHLIFRQFKFRYYSPPPVFINTKTRQVRQGKEVILDNIPEDAAITIDKRFEEVEFIRVGFSGVQYSTYHYSLDWELGIRYERKSQEFNVPLFFHSEHLGKFHDCYKPPIFDCHWIDVYAEKIAELLDIPLVDITEGQSITVSPDQLEKPLIHQLKDKKLRKPPLDNNIHADDLKTFQGVSYDSSKYQIREIDNKVEIKSLRQLMIPRAWKERAAHSFGTFFNLIYIPIFLLTFGFSWFVIPFVESLKDLMFSIPQLFFGFSEIYGWILIILVGLVITIFVLLVYFQTQTIITIASSEILIQESIFPFKSQAIPLENLKRIRQMKIWEKNSIEFVTKDGRIILTGDFENISGIIFIIMKILSQSN
jgi:hypothetical protein